MNNTPNTKEKGKWEFAGLVLAAVITGIFALVSAGKIPFPSFEPQEIRATSTRQAVTATAAVVIREIVVTATSMLPTPIVSASPSSTATNTPTASLTPKLIVPAAPIVNPFCPRPWNLELTYPANGSAVSGLVQIRGTVKPRTQGEWYSLFYRAGIVREEMDYQIQNKVPRSRTTAVGINVPIEFIVLTANIPSVFNGILGVWDTTTVAPGWYSVRLWLRETDSQFLACDEYLEVRR